MREERDVSSQTRTVSLPYYPALALSLLLLINSCLSNWEAAIRSSKMDFFTLWCLPRCASLCSIPDVYSTNGQMELGAYVRRTLSTSNISTLQKRVSGFVLQYYGGRIDTIGTPFLYAAIGVLSSGNYDLDRAIFITASLICYLISIMILCRLLGYSYLLTFLVCTYFVSTFEPFLSDLRVGNLNQIQLLIVSLLIWGMSRGFKNYHSFGTGFALGLATLLKPNIGGILLLNVLIYCFDRRPRRLMLLIGSFCGGCIAFLLASLYFKGIGIWFDFAESLPASLKFSYPLDHGNFSLTSLLFYITKRDYSVSIVFVLLLFLLYVLYQSKREKERLKIRIPFTDIDERAFKTYEVFIEIGISFTITLLISGLSWLHYYTLLIPTILFSLHFCYSVGKRRQLFYLAVLSSMIFFSHFSQIVIRGDPVVTSVLINIATTVFFAMSLLQFWWLHTKEANRAYPGAEGYDRRVASAKR